MPENPFDSQREIEARARAAYGSKSGGGLLDGLRTTPKKKPGGGHGFIVTPEEDAAISRGDTPSTFTRDKDGRLRAKVQ